MGHILDIEFDEIFRMHLVSLCFYLLDVSREINKKLFALLILVLLASRLLDRELQFNFLGLVL